MSDCPRGKQACSPANCGPHAPTCLICVQRHGVQRRRRVVPVASWSSRPRLQANATAAVGTTPITWRIVSGPTGMAIGTASGVVTWTAAATPSAGVAVTVAAINAAGTSTFSYTIATTLPYAAAIQVRGSLAALAAGCQSRSITGAAVLSVPTVAPSSLDAWLW
jgi:hypothetical protein